MKEYFHLAWELAIIEDGRRNNSCYIDVRFTSVFLKSHGLNSTTKHQRYEGYNYETSVMDLFHCWSLMDLGENVHVYWSGFQKKETNIFEVVLFFIAFIVLIQFKLSNVCQLSANCCIRHQ